MDLQQMKLLFVSSKLFRFDRVWSATSHPVNSYKPVGKMFLKCAGLTPFQTSGEQEVHAGLGHRRVSRTLGLAIAIAGRPHE